MRDAATRLGTGASGTADVMADGFFAPLDFALVMQRANPNPKPNPKPNPNPNPKPNPNPTQVMKRAYTPEWCPTPPSPSDFKAEAARKVKGDDDDDDDDDDEDEDDEDTGPLPVCTTDDELEFAAMGAPTEESPHMFRGFSLRRGSSLVREGEAWRAQGAMLAPAPGSPSPKEVGLVLTPTLSLAIPNPRPIMQR